MFAHIQLFFKNISKSVFAKKRVQELNSDPATSMIEPPWITYPGYPPYDMFWRQSGQAWLLYVWEPYWKGLSQEEQKVYLKQWDVPQVWIDCYFETAWLDELDTD